MLSTSAAFAQAGEPEACPAGQVSLDGHCCWPGQAWGDEGRCVGAPQCPEGLVAENDGCVEPAAAPAPAPAAPAAAPAAAAPAAAAPAAAAPAAEVAAEKDLAPKVPVSFHLNGGVLFGSWLGFQVGLQVQIPVWQPLRGKKVGGYLFLSPEGSFLYFQQDRTLGTVYTVGGLFALTAGWHQRLGPISIVPRIGPAVAIANQWGAVPSDTGVYVLGVAGVDVHLRLGRFGLMVGGDYMFGANEGIWLLRIGFGL